MVNLFLSVVCLHKLYPELHFKMKISFFLPFEIERNHVIWFAVVTNQER